jgi:hypothetical protein
VTLVIETLSPHLGHDGSVHALANVVSEPGAFDVSRRHLAA